MKDRENAFENKFAHDEQLSFRIEARCCKLFGLWVAGKMGLSGAEIPNYAGEVVAANLQEAGFGDVLRKVSADLKAKNIEFSSHLLEAELEKAHEEARDQILNETE
ncbi:MAG: DUF1476 domain-containing protein [Alphaproteobacteria bacterium]